MKKLLMLLKMLPKVFLCLISLIILETDVKSNWVEFDRYSELDAGGSSISKLKLSNDGKYIYSVSGRSFNIWDFGTGKLIDQYDYFPKHYYSQIAGISSDDKTVVIIELPSGVGRKKLLAHIYNISNNELIQTIELFESDGMNSLESCVADYDYDKKELIVGYDLQFYWNGSFIHNSVQEGKLCRVHCGDSNKIEIIAAIGVQDFKSSNSKILILGQRINTTVHVGVGTHSIRKNYLLLYDINHKKFDTLNLTTNDSKIDFKENIAISRIDFSNDEQFALGFESPNKMFFWDLKNTKKVPDLTEFPDKLNNFKYLKNDINFVVNYDSSLFFYKKLPYKIVDSILFDYRIGKSVLSISKDNSLILSGTANGKIIKIFTEKLNLVKVDDSNAEFNANDTIVYKNHTVSFYKEIPEEDGIYLWDFGDGNTSNDIKPKHSYNKTGFYEVKLTFLKNGKEFTTIKTNYIEVINENIPEFSSNINLGIAPLTVNFLNKSKGDIDSYYWEFGDGNTSDEENPVNIYSLPGFYHVRLTSTDKKAIKSVYKDFFIVVDSVEVEILEIANKLNFKTNLPESYSIRRVPVSGEEISPNLDIVWAYFCINIAYANKDDEVLLRYIIKDNNIIETMMGNLYMPVNYPIDKKLSRLYFNNFIWDSCNYNHFGVFSQELFSIYNSGVIHPKLTGYTFKYRKDTTYFVKIYNSYEFLIHSLNDYPVGTNKSYFELFAKKQIMKDGINDFEFNTVKSQYIDGNLSVFQPINDTEFMALRTYVELDKYNLDIIKLKNDGSNEVLRSNISKYNSVYIHDFKKISQNLYIACGLVGMNSDSGKAYIAKFDKEGNLLSEFSYDNDVIFFRKIIKLSNNEIVVQIETRSKNQGYYLFDNNLRLLKNYRLTDTNYQITDIYKTFENKIKILATEQPNYYIQSIQSINSEEAVLLIPSNVISTSVKDNNYSEYSNYKNFISISPNPSFDYIDIILKNGASSVASEKVQIFNTLGIEVMNVGIGLDLSTQRIDVSYLQPGVYFIRIGDNYEKFVKL